MKNKGNIIVVCGMLIASIMCAQSPVKVDWGTSNTGAGYTGARLIGKRGNFIYGYKGTPGGYYASLMKYDCNSLSFIGEFPLLTNKSKTGDPFISRTDYSFNQIIVLKNKMYIVVTHADSKVSSLYIQEINNDCKLVGELKKLQDVLTKNKNKPDLIINVQSEDSTKFAVIDEPAELLLNKEYTGEKFGFNIYDENLGEIYKTQAVMPYTGKYFDVEDIKLSNDGNAYLKTRLYLDENKRDKGQSPYNYEILSINPKNDGQVNQYQINLQGKFITDFSYMLNDEKDIVCVGYYNNQETKGIAYVDITGMFYLKINKETKQVDYSNSKDLENKVDRELQYIKLVVGTNIKRDFTIKGLVKLNNGNSVLLADWSYLNSLIFFDRGGGTTRNDEYGNDDIVAININTDGSVKWFVNITKPQETTNDGGAFNSYAYLTNGNKIYFVYNDNPNNVDTKEVKNLKEMDKPEKSVVVVQELSESGDFSKSQLFNTKDNKVAMMPANCLQIRNNAAIIPAYYSGSSFGGSISQLIQLEIK